MREHNPELEVSALLQRRRAVGLRSAGRFLYPVTFAVLAVAVWQWAVSFFPVPEYLLPTPFQILHGMITQRQYFLHHGSITFLEAFLGFALAVVIGFALGTIFAVFSMLERALLPYAIASQAVPIVAVAPLLILWLGAGLSSKVAMAGLICFFPMVVNSTKGLRSVGEQHIALMHIYNATRWQIFWKLRFPASLAYVLSGMKISAALAMIGAIVAEYAGADEGLGYVIMQATYRLDTVQLFAGIFYSALGGWLLFLIVLAIERRFLGRYHG